MTWTHSCGRTEQTRPKMGPRHQHLLRARLRAQFSKCFGHPPERWKCDRQHVCQAIGLEEHFWSKSILWRTSICQGPQSLSFLPERDGFCHEYKGLHHVVRIGTQIDVHHPDGLISLPFWNYLKEHIRNLVIQVVWHFSQNNNDINSQWNENKFSYVK